MNLLIYPKYEVLVCNSDNEFYFYFSVFVICRRGNDSQKAVMLIEKQLESENLLLKDIIGGLHAWAREVESSFPVY